MTENVHHLHWSKSKTVCVVTLFTDFPAPAAAIMDVDRL